MINGVINVRKEKGMTSFGVVARLRRIFGQKKIGHTGTLDPDAEGVLPVCLGRATRLVETLSRGTKTYEAVLLLGRTTDTQDTSGKILRTGELTADEDQIRRTILSFEGLQMQTPPMYGAVKVNGKKLVDLARRGIEVERKAREVEFSDITVLEIRPPRVSFRVTCTHGAYIRTLCHDIGEKLGCGGCMESLLRTRVGTFDLHDALTIGEIEKLKKEENGSAGEAAGHNSPAYTFIRSVDSFYSDLPAITVRNEALPGVLNGGPAASEDVRTEEKAPGGSEVRAYTEDGAFIGVYRASEDASYRLVKYYYDNK